MMTDPIADMLTRIRNAVNAKHKVVEVPASNICLLYTSPSPRDVEESRMPSSA